VKDTIEEKIAKIQARKRTASAEGLSGKGKGKVEEVGEFVGANAYNAELSVDEVRAMIVERVRLLFPPTHSDSSRTRSASSSTSTSKNSGQTTSANRKPIVRWRFTTSGLLPWGELTSIMDETRSLRKTRRRMERTAMMIEARLGRLSFPGRLIVHLK